MADENTYKDWGDAIYQLPSVRELKESMDGLEALSLFVGREDIKARIAPIREELDRLAGIIGRFYNLLGSRNWIFSDYLELSRIETIVAAESADEAERALIAYFKEDETLSFMLTRLNKFPDMQPRLPLLRKAANDFLAGRYYSSVLVTISMADGFVNDVEKECRKGLHARTPEEMESEDCIATILIGLPAAQEVFTRSVHARVDDVIHDVLRNGIMHGMATNYDNDVVAAKAWCLLFAVCDWADAKGKENKGNQEATANNQSTKSFIELFEGIERNAETRKKLDKWTAHFVDLSNPGENDVSVIEDINIFLESWKTNNYGELGKRFLDFVGRSPGKLAGEAREIYANHPITSYQVISIERPAAAVALALVDLKAEDEAWTAKIRFVKRAGSETVSDWEPGAWCVTQYAVDPFRDCQK